MPKNYYENRQECTMYPNQMHIGDLVKIIEKEKQGSKTQDDLVIGFITRILSHGSGYKNGIKVEIETIDTKKLVIGRLQYLVCEKELLG